MYRERTGASARILGPERVSVGVWSMGCGALRGARKSCPGSCVDGSTYVCSTDEPTPTHPPPTPSPATGAVCGDGHSFVRLPRLSGARVRGAVSPEIHGEANDLYLACQSGAFSRLVSVTPTTRTVPVPKNGYVWSGLVSSMMCVVAHRKITSFGVGSPPRYGVSTRGWGGGR